MKHQLYVQRSFGEKMSASFGFLGANWRTLLLTFTCLLLPVALLQAFITVHFQSSIETLTLFLQQRNYTWHMVAPMLQDVAGISGCIWLCATLVSALTFAMLRFYFTREEGLARVTLLELLMPMARNVCKLLLMGVLIMLLLALAFGVIVLLTYVASLVHVIVAVLVAIVLLLALVAACFPLALWTPAYLLDDMPVFTALRRSFRLGFLCWGGVFLVILIMGLAGNILSGALSIPWYVMQAIKQVIADSVETQTSGTFLFLNYLFATISIFAGYLAATFTAVGLSYQYGHAVTKHGECAGEAKFDEETL